MHGAGRLNHVRVCQFFQRMVDPEYNRNKLFPNSPLSKYCVGVTFPDIHSFFRNASASLASSWTRCWLNILSSRQCWVFSFSLYGNECTLYNRHLGNLPISASKLQKCSQLVNIASFSFQGRFLERTVTSTLTSPAMRRCPEGSGTGWTTSQAPVLSGLCLLTRVSRIGFLLFPPLMGLCLKLSILDSRL